MVTHKKLYLVPNNSPELDVGILYIYFVFIDRLSFIMPAVAMFFSVVSLLKSTIHDHCKVRSPNPKFPHVDLFTSYAWLSTTALFRILSVSLLAFSLKASRLSTGLVLIQLAVLFVGNVVIRLVPMDNHTSAISGTIWLSRYRC